MSRQRRPDSNRNRLATLHHEDWAMMAAHLAGELFQVMADVRERFAGLNLEPVAGSPGDFARFLEEDLRKHAGIIKAVGILPQ